MRSGQVRSERALMDQIDLHNGLRWFVGLTLNEPVWEASSFSKNRERLPGAEIAGISSRCVGPGAPQTLAER